MLNTKYYIRYLLLITNNFKINQRKLDNNGKYTTVHFKKIIHC